LNNKIINYIRQNGNVSTEQLDDFCNGDSRQVQIKLLNQGLIEFWNNKIYLTKKAENIEEGTE
jgi:hypothetical protein